MNVQTTCGRLCVEVSFTSPATVRSESENSAVLSGEFRAAHRISNILLLCFYFLSSTPSSTSASTPSTSDIPQSKQLIMSETKGRAGAKMQPWTDQDVVRTSSMHQIRTVLTRTQIIFLLAAIEHSKTDLKLYVSTQSHLSTYQTDKDYQSAPPLPGRTSSSCGQKIWALARLHRAEIDAVLGKKGDGTPGTPKKTGSPRKRKAKAGDVEDGEETPKKRGRPKKAVKSVTPELEEDEEEDDDAKVKNEPVDEFDEDLEA